MEPAITTHRPSTTDIAKQPDKADFTIGVETRLSDRFDTDGSRCCWCLSVLFSLSECRLSLGLTIPPMKSLTTHAQQPPAVQMHAPLSQLSLHPACLSWPESSMLLRLSLIHI